MVSRVSCYMELLLNIHRHTGLEFYCEFIFVDIDLFNQSPDKRLVVFGQNSGLLLKKCAHVGDAFLQFIPTEVLDLSLLLLLTQTINFIADLLVVSLRAGELQELRLQFLQAIFNVGERLIVPLAEDGFNVSLQNFEKIVLVAERPVLVVLLGHPVAKKRAV